MGYVVTATFEIVAGQMAAFLPLIQQNAQASVRDEPGCLQFDVCADTARPDVILLYEVYTERRAFEAHLETPHFARFDAAAASMIASKDVVTYDTLYPNPG